MRGAAMAPCGHGKSGGFAKRSTRYRIRQHIVLRRKATEGKAQFHSPSLSLHVGERRATRPPEQ